MENITRRTAIKISAVGGMVAATGSAATPQQNSPTPTEVEGPFYPVIAQKDVDFDLTQIEGHKERARGKVIIVEGQVLDTEGKPVPDATVELWQACASGRYNHPHDDNPAPIDPNFQGWAVVPSGKQGGFKFTTVMPGIYPAGRNWSRPPHIHFKVAKRGYVELITQMYFPNHPLNDKDRLLQRHTEAERQQMIAEEVVVKDDKAGKDNKKDQITTYRYRVVIEEA